MRVQSSPAPKDAKESKETKETKKARKAQKEEKASKSAAAREAGGGRRDAEVSLSGKALSPDAELTVAETLMEGVHAGKISGEEKDLAMKRVGEILKKYGQA